MRLGVVENGVARFWRCGFCGEAFPVTLKALAMHGDERAVEDANKLHLRDCRLYRIAVAAGDVELLQGTEP